MSDTSNVIQLRPDNRDGNISCLACGSEWFRAHVCLSTDLKLSAFNELRCHECDRYYDYGGDQ